ncbi:MAG TPA: response regulator [Caldimonas sp.]|nr:response regulator [Caldimonas sp.]HEX2542669.1 response regulator [Caldimonas sp.]
MPLSSEFDDLGLSDSDQASILIVDDLPDKLLVFTTVLEDLGHDLVCVLSGAEALKEVLKREFAAILLDVNMPDIDGFETAELIRQYKRSAHTPIIFITSYADEMQTIRGYSLGAVDYILSPVVPEILRSKVNVFVELHLMQRRLRRRAHERIELAAAEAARLVAEENTRRSNFLSQAGRLLSASLDIEVASRQLISMLVPQFATRATLALGNAEEGIGFALQGRAQAYGRCELTAVAASDLEPAERQAIEAILAEPERAPAGDAHGDVLTLPLVTAGRSIGVVVVRLTGPGADHATVAEMVDRSAAALENARLYRSLQLEIEERRAIEEQLQTSNRRKDEFLAMLSHELRNPLAPIRTALEVIRRLAPAEPKLNWATEVTGRQVNHLTRLVEDLLDVARINQGKIALQMESLDLRAVLAHGLETVRPFIESRRHHLTKNIPDVPVMLRGDFARLSQVVANLLNNAAKYTEEGGSIELSLTVPAQGQAVVSVRDDGIGIDGELLPNVFEMFEQGKQSLDRSQGGLGVGLTLVQRLVELHEGTVQAVSDGVGRGSEFRVTLPCLAEVADPHPDRGDRRAQALPACCRVLVVDDNRDAAEATSVLLELSGHEVKTVGDGAEALASAPIYAPDVVLLDIGLPGMDGYEVAVHLRTLAETRASCLIALTGYGQPADRARAREAGFDHHLTKPADPDELLRLVESFLKTRRSGAGMAVAGREASNSANIGPG